METYKPRVLLVDDEPNILRLMGISLESFGCEVHAFENPEDALREDYADVHYDLAFIDVRMQPISGYEVLRELNRRDPAIHVVLMSAYESAPFISYPGNPGFLQKPFEIIELRNIVAQHLYH